MPVLYQIKPIVITSTGGNLVQPVGESYTYYNITGSATMVGNLQITPSGTPSTGLTYIFVWKAVLDIITNSTTVTVFGQALTSVQVQKKNVITCTYNGSTWDVDVQTFNTESGFIETSQLGTGVVTATNIANGAITASLLANGSVTLAKLASNSVDSSKIVDGTIVTADLADNSVTTAKIVDANVTTAKIVDSNITTAKIADSNVTTAKIADGDVTAIKLDSNSVTTVKILDANVTTAKLADDSVTNAKLNTMTASSIKIGDSSGNPQDLPIGLDEIPIGNGTTVTTISKSSLIADGWGLTGNSGTIAGTNFLGTTDAEDLVFKVNSFESGRINLSDNNTSFGRLSLYVNTGFSNTAFGSQALTDNLSGARNTALGTASLNNVSSGTDNVGLGFYTGSAITTGSYNTIIGSSAGVNSIAATSRIALGSGAEATEDYQFAIPNDVTKIKWRGTSYVLPATDGTAGQKLTTDGAGNLSWS